jgi:hypothetical protein
MPYKDPAQAAKRDKAYRIARRAEGNELRDKVEKRLRRSPLLRKQELRESTTQMDPLPLPTQELKIKVPAHGLRIAVIPDLQARRGVPLDHVKWAGQYIARQQPDVVVIGGDWWDMPSLSTWSPPGNLDKWNSTYKNDVDAGIAARETLENELAKAPGYDPAKEEFEGNHEDRIDRAIIANPNQLYGMISKKDLKREEFGWRVHPFLQPAIIAGVAFCHYFPRGVMGKAIQSPSILLKHLHMSAFAFHQQGRQIDESRRADGGMLTAIISGSFYQHNEPYMSPLANRHWRGMWMLNEVKDGQYDYMPVSINFLKRKFG